MAEVTRIAVDNTGNGGTATGVEDFLTRGEGEMLALCGCDEQGFTMQ